MTVNNLLELDEIDAKIVGMLQEDPQATHSQIAEIIERSQPAVGIRIKKLEKSGLLQKSCGVNLKNINCALALITIQTGYVEETKEILTKDPHILNAFFMTGDYNLFVIAVHKTEKKLYNFVNKLFLSDGNDRYIKKISVNFITGLLNDLVMPIAL